MFTSIVSHLLEIKGSSLHGVQCLETVVSYILSGLGGIFEAEG